MRSFFSMVLMAAAVLVAGGCHRAVTEYPVAVSYGDIALTMEAYASPVGTKSVNVDTAVADEVERRITDCNVWIFDVSGQFLLHFYSEVKDGKTVFRPFSGSERGARIYVVANSGGPLDFTPASEDDMKNLVASFDNTKFNVRGLPAAGAGAYVPGSSKPFSLTRLVGKYRLMISDATAYGERPYGFTFADGKVICRNVGKTVTPFKTGSKTTEIFSNADDIEFLSSAELAAIDSGAAVEKTLYLLENVWAGGATEGAVIGGLCNASYVEISGKGTIDKGAGHVYEKVTCRYLLGADGNGGAGVVRNTRNTLSLSLTNDILSESGWRVEAGGENILASAAFNPASMTLTDDEAKTVTIAVSDHWAVNEEIEYILEIRDVSGSNNNVLIEVGSKSIWESYTSGAILKGSKTIRLTNKNIAPGQTKVALWAVAKLAGKAVDLGKIDIDLIVSDYEIIIE